MIRKFFSWFFNKSHWRVVYPNGTISCPCTRSQAIDAAKFLGGSIMYDAADRIGKDRQ